MKKKRAEIKSIALTILLSLECVLKVPINQTLKIKLPVCCGFLLLGLFGFKKKKKKKKLSNDK